MMIVQCRQCRTKFRFDDAQLEGDGIWMRCSRCQHVFFQDNPHAVKSAPEPAPLIQPPPVKAVPVQKEEAVPDAAPVVSGDDDVARFIDDVMKVQSTADEQPVPEIEKGLKEEKPAEGPSIADELLLEKDEPQEKKSSGRGFWRVLKIVAWAVLVIIVIPAVIYFFVLPQTGDRILKVINRYVDLGFRDTDQPEIVTGQVKLQDIRQRILNNNILGPIRVVEGVAVNQADYPISRIAVKGEIVDAYAVVLGERTTYAGNIVTDEELTMLSEEELLKKFSRPEGGNNSNDKIMPKGMIPFMIVFSREPAGVIKTTVRTVGAERLLSH